VVETQGVTERDQLGGPLRRQRSRDFAHGQHVAFRDGLLGHLPERLRRHPNRPGGDRQPVHHRLVADIHHPCAPGLIHV